MTQETHNTRSHQWWQLGLPIAVTSAALIAGLAWPYQNVRPGVAQTVADLQPDAAAMAPADETAETELTADDITAGAQAHANGHPTHAEIGERLRLEQWLAEGRRTGAISTPRATEHTGANQPTQALADQHRRVLATRDTARPPALLLQNPSGPPRMDSGDPHPDRIRPPDAEAAH